MPVTHTKSDFFGTIGPSGYAAPNNSVVNGKGSRLMVRCEHAADALAGSTIKIATLPASVVICDESRFDASGINLTGGGAIDVGAPGATNGLSTGATAAGGTSGVYIPVAQFEANQWGLPLWQQLGLSEMPVDGKIDLLVTLKADATAAGIILFDLHIANHV